MEHYWSAIGATYYGDPFLHCVLTTSTSWDELIVFAGKGSCLGAFRDHVVKRDEKEVFFSKTNMEASLARSLVSGSVGISHLRVLLGFHGVGSLGLEAAMLRAQVVPVSRTA